MKKWILMVWACLCVVNLMAQAPIKTLLITGQNNHNWQVSHVVLKRILENSGRFMVDFAVSPAAGEDMSGFVLDFKPYALVVLDYNGDAWPGDASFHDALPCQRHSDKMAERFHDTPWRQESA